MVDKKKPAPPRMIRIQETPENAWIFNGVDVVAKEEDRSRAGAAMQLIKAALKERGTIA